MILIFAMIFVIVKFTLISEAVKFREEYPKFLRLKKSDKLSVRKEKR